MQTDACVLKMNDRVFFCILYVSTTYYTDVRICWLANVVCLLSLHAIMSYLTLDSTLKPHTPASFTFSFFEIRAKDLRKHKIPQGIGNWLLHLRLHQIEQRKLYCYSTDNCPMP